MISDPLYAILGRRRRCLFDLADVKPLMLQQFWFISKFSELNALQGKNASIHEKSYSFMKSHSESPNLQDARKDMSHIPLIDDKTRRHIDIFATMKLLIGHSSPDFSKKNWH